MSPMPIPPLVTVVRVVGSLVGLSCKEKGGKELEMSKHL